MKNLLIWQSPLELGIFKIFFATRVTPRIRKEPNIAKPIVRVASSFVIFLLFVIASSQVRAQQISYLVENVATSASAKSAGDAKVSATANARREAFVTILSRLSLPASDAEKITNDQLFDMVRSEQITEEKIAGSNYSAIFNIMFAKSAVDRVLKDKSGSASKEIAAENYLLIPVKIIKQKNVAANSTRFILWDDDNDWRKALDKDLKSKSLKNLIIPQPDLSNVAMINNDNIEKLEYSAIEPLFSRYKAVGAYVVFFYFDDIENKVSIAVKNIKKLQKRQIKLNFVNIDRLKYDGLLAKVADKTVEYLVQSQSESLLEFGSNSVKFEIQISSFGDFLMLKNKIENSNLINQMNIEAISKDYVKTTVNYIGSDPDIIAAFSKFGLVLKKKSDNYYAVFFVPVPTMSPSITTTPNFNQQ